MSTTPPDGDDDRPSPAEAAALDHLAVLRGVPDAPEAALVTGVLRTARLQRAVLAPAGVAGSIAAAVGATLVALFGTPAEKERT